MRSHLLVIVYIFLSFSLTGQQVYDHFFSLEFDKAMQALRVNGPLGEDQRVFLDDLIHIWKNSGTDQVNDSQRVAGIDPDTENPKLLLLLGSYYLFNGKRKEALPILLEVLRRKEDLDDNLVFITYLGLLNIYQSMYVLGNEMPQYVNALHQHVGESKLKEAWYMIYLLKYDGAQAPTESAEGQFINRYESVSSYYAGASLSDGLKAHFAYQFGSAMILSDSLNKAEQYFRQVLLWSEGKPYLRQTAFNAHLLLAGILSATHRFDSARYLFSEALELRTTVDSLLWEINYSNAIASGYFERLGQWDSAYFHLKRSITSILPVFVEDNNMRVNELRESYEAERREEDLAYQMEQIKNKNRIIFLSVVSGALLTLLLLVLIIAFSRLNKKKSEIETLMRELHHRVKNNLQVVSSLMGLQSMQLTDEKAKEAVAEGKGRIRAMSIIHQKLYLHDQFTSLNVREYLSNLTREIVQVHGNADSVHLQIEIADQLMDADTLLPIGLIVNELVSNSLKHAMPHVSDLTIKVSLQTEQGEYELVVSDNGPGYRTEGQQEEVTSFGLKLVEILLKQLRGKMEVTSLQGVAYRLTFNTSHSN